MSILLIPNRKKNLAAEIRIDIGDVEKGFSEADEIFEAEYAVPKVQQAHIEPHVAITYWDEMTVWLFEPARRFRSMYAGNWLQSWAYL